MTETVDPLTDTSSLDAHDFTLECEVTEPIDGQRVKCTKPAVWIGIPPCGHEGYFCEVHHSDGRSFVCEICKNMTLLAVYRWVRI